jgi:hypothetical protein
MARPTKQGIDYFPVDVQFDEKIELLIAEKGGDALAVLVTIWQLSYQNNGYYVTNGKDLFLLIKRRIMIDLKLIEEIVNIALERDIFSKKLHKKYKILTSKAIQKRYFEAAKRKKSIKVNKNFVLVNINEFNVNINPIKEEVEEEEEIEDIFSYQKIFDNYTSKKNLVNHKKLTDEMKKAIDVARKRLEIESDQEMCILIDRHSLLVEETKNNGQYAIRKRGIKEFFGQKVKDATHLICSEYQDDGSKWVKYDEDRPIETKDPSTAPIEIKQYHHAYNVLGNIPKNFSKEQECKLISEVEILKAGGWLK